MGSTICRQVDLGCIRKFVKNELGSKQNSMVSASKFLPDSCQESRRDGLPPGSVSQITIFFPQASGHCQHNRKETRTINTLQNK